MSASMRSLLRFARDLRDGLDGVEQKTFKSEGRNEALDTKQLVPIETIRDVFEVSFLVQNKPVPFLIPAHNAVWGYGFRYTHDEHPWVAYLTRKNFSLERFYSAYQPKNLLDAFSPTGLVDLTAIEKPELLTDLPSAPWIYSDRFRVFRKNFHGEETFGSFMGREHGHQHRGPVSNKKVVATGAALNAVHESLSKYGYCPDIGGYIRGYFLAYQSNFLFLICGGQHRAAAWSALGNHNIPVIFQPGYPRMVDVNQLHSEHRRVAMFYFNEQYSNSRRDLVSSLL